MADITEIRLIDLVPPSIRDDPTIQAAAAAIDAELQKVTAAIPTTLLMARIDELPEDVIDCLAWQFHVDFYEPGISLDQKRRLVKTAIASHRKKGTPYAVEEVVTAILEGAIVQEWFDYGGEPYYFRVIKINGQVAAEMYPKLKKAVEMVKNTRSWLEGVSLSRTVDSSVYFGVCQGVHKIIDIFPSAFTMPDITNGQYYAQMMQVHKKVYI